ncbi:MAG: NifU family protein [Planctomycetota bacterium]|jgi:Fe-S cluster biogenesis protein NfuA
MSDVKISAEPLAVGSMCKFIVDRPIYQNRSYWFGSAESAELAPLAKRLFAVEGVAQVLISHQTITVTKISPAPWQAIGPHIGAAIREHIASGEDAVSADLQDKLPSAEELRTRVEAIINDEIAPSVASHGGSIRVVDVKDNVVLLEMGGGCQGCSSATATLKFGVEAAIRRAIPEVGEIIDTTDHSAGANPYYTAGTA